MLRRRLDAHAIMCADSHRCVLWGKRADCSGSFSLPRRHHDTQAAKLLANTGVAPAAGAGAAGASAGGGARARPQLPAVASTGPSGFSSGASTGAGAGAGSAQPHHHRVHMGGLSAPSAGGFRADRERDCHKHRCLFEEGGLRDGDRLTYITAQGEELLHGIVQDMGILCQCCGKVVSCSQFEMHAGRGNRRAPYDNIYTDQGVSLRRLASQLRSDRPPPPPRERDSGRSSSHPGSDGYAGGGAGPWERAPSGRTSARVAARAASPPESPSADAPPPRAFCTLPFGGFQGIPRVCRARSARPRDGGEAARALLPPMLRDSAPERERRGQRGEAQGRGGRDGGGRGAHGQQGGAGAEQGPLSPSQEHNAAAADDTCDACGAPSSSPRLHSCAHAHPCKSREAHAPPSLGTCTFTGVCEAGPLLCCDGCPAMFHPHCVGLREVPPAHQGWLCAECADDGPPSDGAQAAAVAQRARRLLAELDTAAGGCVLCRCSDFTRDKFGPRTVLLCDQCECEFHVGCLRRHGVRNQSANKSVSSLHTAVGCVVSL